MSTPVKTKSAKTVSKTASKAATKTRSNKTVVNGKVVGQQLPVGTTINREGYVLTVESFKGKKVFTFTRDDDTGERFPFKFHFGGKKKAKCARLFAKEIEMLAFDAEA